MMSICWHLNRNIEKHMDIIFVCFLFETLCRPNAISNRLRYEIQVSSEFSLQICKNILWPGVYMNVFLINWYIPTHFALNSFLVDGNFSPWKKGSICSQTCGRDSGSPRRKFCFLVFPILESICSIYFFQHAYLSNSIFHSPKNLWISVKNGDFIAKTKIGHNDLWTDFSRYPSLWK